MWINCTLNVVLPVQSRTGCTPKHFHARKKENPDLQCENVGLCTKAGVTLKLWFRRVATQWFAGGWGRSRPVFMLRSEVHELSSNDTGPFLWCMGNWLVSVDGSKALGAKLAFLPSACACEKIWSHKRSSIRVLCVCVFKKIGCRFFFSLSKRDVVVFAKFCTWPTERWGHQK